MGARKEDYAARVPAGSYIHVDDFNSPRDLALYLHELDKNDTKYNEYFRWKGTVEMVDQKYWCRLCMMPHLQADDGYVHWYEDYHRWWNGACSAMVLLVDSRLLCVVLLVSMGVTSTDSIHDS